LNIIPVGSVEFVFPYHYGSYATKGEFKEKVEARIVSIPLWFLRNGRDMTRTKFDYHVFPYHYGSYATYYLDSYLQRKFAFPYHYGSHATYE